MPNHAGSNISMNPSKCFEFDDKACRGQIKGLLTHGQVRADKDDMHPQPDLIQMLLEL